MASENGKNMRLDLVEREEPRDRIDRLLYQSCCYFPDFHLN